MGKLPPLAPLVAFRAAARHGSFTIAAHELNLTSGAVSKSVKQLEEFFAFDLFHRTNRGIHLTERGRVFAERTEAVLEQLEKTCERLMTGQGRHRLSVSCEPSLAMRWLMPRLEAFRRIEPRVDVQLSTAGGPIDLSAQGVHLAIRRSDFIWPRGYACRTLGKECMGPVCSPGYWTDNARKPARLLHTRTRPQAWPDWRALSGVTLPADTEQFFDHFYFSLQAATAGMGMAMGPEPLVRDDIARGLLVAPYGFCITPAEYMVLSPRTGDECGYIGSFTEWLAEELALPRD